MRTFILRWPLVATVVTVLLAACAQMPVARNSDLASLFHDQLFKAPAAPIDTRAIFAVDAPMLRFIADDVVPETRHGDPRQALFDALKDELAIDYDSKMTGTAAQTFAARKGNCLSLVIMAAALARQLDIRVTFQEVVDFDTWSRDAGFAILSQHVNLVLGSRPPPSRLAQGNATPMIVDFVPARDVEHAVVRTIAEPTIIAMYLNNRAAEILVDGDVDRAYWFARAAIEADPTFPGSANTLGVIYSRRGQTALAERAVRYALEHDPDNLPALSNLAGILTAEGRATEAQVVAERLARIQRHPPFEFYDRGVDAMQAGQFKEAARLFEKALAQRPYDAPSHFQLAVVATRLGDLRRARKQLALAEQNSTTPESRALYAAKLRHLKMEPGAFPGPLPVNPQPR